MLEEIESYLSSIDYTQLALEDLYNYVRCVTELEKTKFEITPLDITEEE